MPHDPHQAEQQAVADEDEDLNQFIWNFFLPFLSSHGVTFLLHEVEK